MKCPNCNFEVAENTKFCPECGTKMLENNAETTSSSEVTDETSNTSSTKEVNEEKKAKKTKKTKKIIIISVSSFVVCGIIFLVLYLFGVFENYSDNYYYSEPPHTHAYGDWVITVQPTCSTYGVKKKTCSCGDFVMERASYRYGHQPNSSNICTVCNTFVVPMNDTEVKYAEQVNYITKRGVEYDKTNDRFEITFAFETEDEYRITAPTLIDIRIKNDNNVVVYQDTIMVETNDFVSNVATIYVNSSKITKDVEWHGTFYFKVYNPDYFTFSEVNYSVYNLPLKPTTLITPSVPAIYNDTTGWDTSVKITSIRYEMDGDDMTIYFSGEKTYDEKGNNYSQSCSVGYKIYDSSGFVVDSGTFYSNSLCVGDKFKDEAETVYNLKIGEVYTLELLNVS